MKCHCNQCRAEWDTRFERIPVQCPRCKRVDWREPKKGVTSGSDNSTPAVQDLPQPTPRVARPGKRESGKVDLQEVPRGEATERSEGNSDGQSDSGIEHDPEICQEPNCKLCRQFYQRGR